MPFQKGSPGGPGRPKGKRVKFLLGEILHDHDFQWADQLAQAFKTQNRSLLAIYEKFAPYLFVPLRAKEIEIKIDTPEDSVRNAHSVMAELLAAENYGNSPDARSASTQPGSHRADVETGPPQSETTA